LNESLARTPGLTLIFAPAGFGKTILLSEWITGLQLAALSMQGRRDIKGFVEAFTGSHRCILDDLTDEVLEQQPMGTKNFF
jgi:ATP/maltotriose-dependent transcriptional regulator MalT